MSQFSESRPAVLSPEAEEVLYLAVINIMTAADQLPIGDHVRLAIYKSLSAISSVMKDCDRLPSDPQAAE